MYNLLCIMRHIGDVLAFCPFVFL